MKRLAFLILILTQVTLGQVVLTPNVGLEIPSAGSQNWNTPLNYNFNLIDQILGGTLQVPGLGLQLKSIFGTGAPSIACNANNVTQGYFDTSVSPFNEWLCGTSGWVQLNTGGVILPSSGIVYATSTSTARTATATDIAGLLTPLSGCSTTGYVYSPATNTCSLGGGNVSTTGLTNGTIVVGSASQSISNSLLTDIADALTYNGNSFSIPSTSGIVNVGVTGSIVTITAHDATTGGGTIYVGSSAVSTYITSQGINTGGIVAGNIVYSGYLSGNTLQNGTPGAPIVINQYGGNPVGLDINAGLQIGGPLELGTNFGTVGQCVLSAGPSSTPTWGSCGGSSMIYPGAGIANSTGTAWGTSYTTSGTSTVIALANGATLVSPTINNATLGSSVTGPGTFAVDASGNVTAASYTVPGPATGFAGYGTSSFTIGAAAQVGTGATTPTCSNVCDSFSGTLSFTTGTGTLTAGTILTVNVAGTRTGANGTTYNNPTCMATDVTSANAGILKCVASNSSGTVTLTLSSPYALTASQLNTIAYTIWGI